MESFSVKIHTPQAETSHSPSRGVNAICSGMVEVDDVVRARLKQERERQGVSASQLSVRAGLNRRAVTDIEEGRAVAPKITTVFALAEALGVSPSYLLGLTDVPTDLEREFLAFLRQYDRSGQEQLLKGLRALQGDQS